MNLPKEKILINTYLKNDLEALFKYAEKALKEWEPTWSPFLSAPVIEEAKREFNILNDITCNYEGGFTNAERQRICFARSDSKNDFNTLDIPIKGIHIKGDFLFDRATINDFRKAIQSLGAKPEDLGDIWLIRDRGAQAVCSKECADLLDKKMGKLREVEISIKSLNINEMEIPFQRSEKIITTVEASTRIDAIASAGFGLSRSKITSQIKQGYLRLNWIKETQPSKGVTTGDLIHLEKKGSLKILNINKTKKERWRIKLLRH